MAPSTAWQILKGTGISPEATLDRLAGLAADYPAAMELARDSAALYEPLGDRHGLARAHRFLGEAAAATGDFTLAASHCRQAIASARHAGNLRDEAAARNILGQVHRLADGCGRPLADIVAQALGQAADSAESHCPEPGPASARQYQHRRRVSQH